MFSKKNKKIIEIDGMMCNHCAKKVESALLSIENISKVKIDLKGKKAIITLNGAVDNDEIKTKIEDIEYKVIKIEEA